MTVPANVSSIAYTGNGVTTDFAVTFPYLDETHLVVKVTPSGGVETVKTLGLHYTVSPDNGASGTVTFLSAPAADDAVVIERTVPLTQDVAFRSQGSFSPAVHEDALDKEMMGLQQLDRRVSSLENAGTNNDAVAGDGLYVSSSTWHVGAGDGITAGSDSIAVKFGTVNEMSVVDAADADEGVESLAARVDHKHTVSVGTPGAIAIGDAATEGVANTLARSDHKHSLAAPAAPANVTKAAASAGISTAPARADHKHDVSTAAPVTIGTANAEGTATTLARSDHTHNHGVQTDSTLHAVATAVAAGFVSAEDKSKLDGYGPSVSGTLKTANATPTLILQIDMPASSTYMVDVMIAARATTLNEGAGYKIVGTFIREGGVVSQIGTTTVVATHETTSTWDVSFATSTIYIQVYVTGAAATTINWRARARICEIT